MDVGLGTQGRTSVPAFLDCVLVPVWNIQAGLGIDPPLKGRGGRVLQNAVSDGERGVIHIRVSVNVVRGQGVLVVDDHVPRKILGADDGDTSNPTLIDILGWPFKANLPSNPERDRESLILIERTRAVCPRIALDVVDGSHVFGLGEGRHRKGKSSHHQEHNNLLHALFSPAVSRPAATARIAAEGAK